MTDYKPGDRVPVYINGRLVLAHIDNSGVLRFVQDPTVMYRGVPVNSRPGSGPGQMDWNALAIDSSVSMDDRIRMHCASGYSVDGFCDCRLRVRVETPDWGHVDRNLEIEELHRDLLFCSARLKVEDPQASDVMVRAAELIIDYKE